MHTGFVVPLHKTIMKRTRPRAMSINLGSIWGVGALLGETKTLLQANPMKIDFELVVVKWPQANISL